MRAILFFALIATSGVLGAQTIFKCQGAKGAITYQTDPCAAGQSTKAVKAYAPVYDSPVAAARLLQTEAVMNQRASQASAPNYGQVIYNNGPDNRGQKRANCAVAKANRDATLEQVGLNRTYELLQQLDESVNRACKGT